MKRKKWCDNCNKYHLAQNFKKRRLNTSYYDDKQNWLYSCHIIYQETIEYHEQDWKDDYSSCL